MKTTVSEIANAVGQCFGGVTAEDIASRTRTRSVALARMVTMFVARSELGFSYPELAREVGLKDHTTAMHAVQRVADMLSSNDERIVWAVAAGESVAEKWRGPPPPGKHDSMRARRRQIADTLRELVAEAQQIDALLGPAVVKATVADERQVGAAE